MTDHPHISGPTPGIRPLPIRLLYAVFFASGFSGLIYESIWSHYLKLLLGHAAYAQAVVLVVFVGGLAVGAWLAGQVSERVRQPLVWYAVIEAAVGIYALAFHRIYLGASDWAVASLLPAACDPSGPCAVNWLLASALILPPALLLGTTFPLMSAAVIRQAGEPGRNLGRLYFFNSGGAALGVLFAGFWFIPTLGLPGTMLLAGSINLAVALSAWLIARFAFVRAEPTRPATPAGSARDAWLVPLLVVSALTGLSSFIYEVAWIRMLTLVLGAATHSFELMLSTFIAGLAIGAWWIRSRIDHHPDLLRSLAVIQIVMGGLAIATLPLYVMAFDAMAFLLQALGRNESGYVLFNLASAAIAAAIMLPAAICAGMTLPIITALLLKRGLGERRIGQVYGVNTLGAIAGVLLTLHLLLPVLGMRPTLMIAAAIDVLLGVWLLRFWRESGREEQLRAGLVPVAVAGAVALGAFVLALLNPLTPQRLASGVFRTGEAMLREGQRALFHADGKTATITVLQAADGRRSLMTNGKVDGATFPGGEQSSSDDYTVTLLGALGPLHHPQARHAAVIGLGTGITTAVLLQAPGMERVDSIEIEPLVLQAATLFRPRNAAALDDPRSHIHIDDARAFFAKSPRRYDLIVSEPSNPWVSGVSNLFTTQFYRVVSRSLADDGVFVQWLHIYEASPELAVSIVRAFSEVFPHYRVFMPNTGDLVLVGSRQSALALQPSVYERGPRLRAALEAVQIPDLNTLMAYQIGDERTLSPIARSYGVPANSDFHPYVDARGAKDRFMKAEAQQPFEMFNAPVVLAQEWAVRSEPLGWIKQADGPMPLRLFNLASAWHGLQWLRGTPPPTQASGYMGDYFRDYALVAQWARSCELPGPSQALWPSLLNVAQELNSGNAIDDLRRFWRDLIGRCGARLDAERLAWLRLFAAVGERDHETVAVQANRVIEGRADLPLSAREYAVLSGSAALLAQGRQEDARAFFLKEGKPIDAQRLKQPWWRMLVLKLRQSPASEVR